MKSLIWFQNCPDSHSTDVPIIYLLSNRFDEKNPVLPVFLIKRTMNFIARGSCSFTSGRYYNGSLKNMNTPAWWGHYTRLGTYKSFKKRIENTNTIWWWNLYTDGAACNYMKSNFIFFFRGHRCYCSLATHIICNLALYPYTNCIEIHSCYLFWRFPVMINVYQRD